MRWHKLISTLLHPVVMPTIGVLIYLFFLPIRLSKQQLFVTFGIVFTATYIIPLILLVFLKAIGYIKSFQVHSIEERKIPLFFMMSLLYILHLQFQKLTIVADLSYLFYGVVLGLVIIYFLFFFKIKSSLHMLSIGGAIAYFLIFQQIYQINTTPVVIIFMLLAGLLASSRLYLKAHTSKEVYIGFFIGFLTQFIAYYIL